LSGRRPVAWMLPRAKCLEPLMRTRVLFALYSFLPPQTKFHSLCSWPINYECNAMGWPGLWPMLYASSPASRAVVRGHPLSCLYSVFTVNKELLSPKHQQQKRWRALRPPRVVFVLGRVNSLTSGQKKRKAISLMAVAPHLISYLCGSSNSRLLSLFFQMSELYLKRLQRVYWLPIR
jgi:hypothetical protein